MCDIKYKVTINNNNNNNNNNSNNNNSSNYNNNINNNSNSNSNSSKSVGIGIGIGIGIPIGMGRQCVVGEEEMEWLRGRREKRREVVMREVEGAEELQRRERERVCQHYFLFTLFFRAVYK